VADIDGVPTGICSASGASGPSGPPSKTTNGEAGRKPPPLRAATSVGLNLESLLLDLIDPIASLGLDIGRRGRAFSYESAGAESRPAPSAVWSRDATPQIADANGPSAPAGARGWAATCQPRL